MRPNSCLPLFFGLLLLLALEVRAVERIVPDQYLTIQAAINASSDGDVVRVRAGTYNETDIDLGSLNLRIFGEDGASNTVIDGGGLGPILTIRQQQTRDTVIEGLTFRNATVQGEDINGGCLTIRGASPTIQNNIFEQCASKLGDPSSTGGAIKVSPEPGTDTASNPRLAANVFRNNRSYIHGGAVHIFQASAEIVGNSFLNNLVEGGPVSGGGGLRVGEAGDVLIQGNHFEGNSASFAGGGISIFGINPDFDFNVEILQNTIVNNGFGRFGGGLHIETQSSSSNSMNVRIIDNVIDGNEVVNREGDGLTEDFNFTSGGGIQMNFFSTPSKVEIIGNTISGNSTHNSNCTENVGQSRVNCGLGGGVGFIRGMAFEQVVSGNHIVSNSADVYAGGIFDKVKLSFTNNIVEGNRARFTHNGIGCFATSSNPAECTIAGNRFLDNRYESDAYPGSGSANDSGALNVRASTVSVTNNLFARNKGSLGIAFVGNNDALDQFAEFTHNTFVDNTVTNSGFASLTIRGNGHSANNSFSESGRSLRHDYPSSDPGSSSISANNFAPGAASLAQTRSCLPSFTISDCDITDFATAGELNTETVAESNTDVEPQMIDRAGGNYNLSAASPLIDQASCVSGVAVDLDGDPRPFGPGCEAGAFEHAGEAIGTYNVSNRGVELFNLSRDTSNAFDFPLGADGLCAVSGDWDGDGIDTLGVYDPTLGQFNLSASNSTSSSGALTVSFASAGGSAGHRCGAAGSDESDLIFRDRFELATIGNGELVVPVAGDWNGDGKDSVGLFYPLEGRWLYRPYTNDSATLDTEVTISLASLNDSLSPIVGDWNGDGRQGLGVYDPVAGRFYLSQQLVSGAADIEFAFGSVGSSVFPLSGDWDADGVESIGVMDVSSGEVSLRNSNSAGASDQTFSLLPGDPSERPLSGNWGLD